MLKESCWCNRIATNDFTGSDYLVTENQQNARSDLRMMADLKNGTLIRSITLSNSKYMINIHMSRERS